MARISRIRIKGYRSIKDECVITLPKKMPLVLIGENNAGKSNVVKALDIVLGEYWPSSHDVEDHEFWGRTPQGRTIEIEVFTEDLVCEQYGDIDSLYWACYADPPREPSFKAFTSDGDGKWCSRQLRQQCQAMIVSADRRLSYQLSYTSKRTLLSRLMHRFHECLIADSGRVKRLKEEFKQIVALFGEVGEFKEFREGLTEQLGAMLDGMSYGLDVDFSAYDPSNFFHSLRVFPSEEGETRTFEELGTGQEQILALVFAHAYARAFYGGIVLVIEEPEAHLHPLAQDWLGRTIRDMAKDGLQIILTTHSPSFVDMLGLEGLALIRKEDGATSARQITASELADFCLEHNADPDRTDAEAILPFYANSATPEIVAGLFARRVVLVEGQTEGMALPIYLLKAELDVVKRGIAIIPVWGKGNLAKWWRFFSAFGLPVYVMFDNDNEHDKKGEKRSGLLTTIGLPDRDIQALLGVEDWLVETNYAIFGADFETALRTEFPGYDALEAEARKELGGDSKSLIGKYIAERLEIDPDSEGGKRLKELAKYLRQLAPPAPE